MVPIAIFAMLPVTASGHLGNPGLVYRESSWGAESETPRSRDKYLCKSKVTGMKKVLIFLATCFGFLNWFTAEAKEFKPAVVFDLADLMDKSFNEAAYLGLKSFEEQYDVKVSVITPKSEGRADFATKVAQLEQAIEDGHDPIITVGFVYGLVVEKLALENPNSRFVAIDWTADLPNVQSIVFREYEGSFLVGALAAMASKNGKIGFVGGMDSPLIRAFGCGYAQGAKSINPDLAILGDMIGTTVEAFDQPERGRELALAQYDDGADVVFHAAGGSGVGVLDAAAERRKLAIGVDSNQNYIHPGFVLTSMLKRVDVAVYLSLRGAMEEVWQPGIRSLGLAEQGVGWALDEHNTHLISPEMQAKVEELEFDIVGGTTEVVDYSVTVNCPFMTFM